nr:ribonuclease H-like domain-containing protein [Tanacetum cinerariifolium]
GVRLYHPSWLKVSKERKATLIADIGHLQKAYNTNKAAFKVHHWVIDTEIGSYNVEKIRRARPESITALEWDKYIQFWNDYRNIARAAQNRQNRAKSTVISRQGSESLARLRDEMRQSSATQEYPSLIDTFFIAHTVDGPGNARYRGTNVLTEKYVRPTVSLRIVAGECIPVDHSPANIPQRHVARERARDRGKHCFLRWRSKMIDGSLLLSLFGFRWILIIFFLYYIFMRIGAGYPTTRRSASEAEYRGVVNVVAETGYVIHCVSSSATLVYCDNVSDVYLSCNPVQHQHMKHIEIDKHFIRDLSAVGQVRVLHVPSRYQYADIFAKGLPSALFEEYRFGLSVRGL